MGRKRRGGVRYTEVTGKQKSVCANAVEEGVLE